jgi:hypothetical protein
MMIPTQTIPASILARLSEATSYPSRLEDVVRPLLDLLEEPYFRGGEGEASSV